MLLKIVIINIQSHKHTIIDLVGGVNVITGITDAGKSSVLNAVYWVLYNRPSADGLRSDWGGDSSVELHFTNGIIIRMKTKTKNVYILNGDEMLAGRNVPEPVQAFLNCSDLNFQDQFAPAFMLDWKPTERGVYLNKVTNLQIIDKTVNNIKKTIGKENTLIKSYQLQLKEYKAEIKEYRGLDDFEGVVVALEEKQAKIKEYNDKTFDLERLIDKIKTIDRVIKKNSKKLKLKKQVEDLNEILSALKICKSKYDKLLQLKENILDCDIAIKKQKKIVRVKKKEFQELMPDKCPLCKRGD